ncbi:MAG: pilus assembly protein CpaA [Alphaproteobacteria bacterium]|nr:pilus assembly protein CpaA [Alphaproteobacteria bacterium]
MAGRVLSAGAKRRERVIEAINLGAVAVFALALVAAAVSDVGRLEIPNVLPIIIAAAFVLAYPDADWLARLERHASAGVVLLMAGLICFRFSLLGGGDVKLIAACGLWTGWQHLPAFLLTTVLFGGVVSLGIVVVRLILRNHPFERPAFLARLVRTNTGVPYGLAIAAAGLLLVPGLIGTG